MRTRAADRASWRVFGLLMAGALVGVLALMPYALTLLERLPSSVVATLPPRWLVLSLQLVQAMVLIGAATALGLWLGPKVGLGAPLLYDLVRHERTVRSRLRALVLPCTAWGLLVGLAIVLLDRLVFAPRLAAVESDVNALQSPAWQGLLASFYGAIPEELLMRLGLMTVVVWIGLQLTRTAVPGPVAVWAAIVTVSVLFGLGHLPTTVALLPLTPLVVVRALVLNGIGGIVFGWLYWKRGIVAAMLAHFSADVILHAVAPLLTH